MQRKGNTMTLAEKLPKSIEHYDDERDCGNGIIIMLKSGYKWCMDDHGLHTRGFDTVSEAKAEFKFIESCSCKLCDDKL